MQTNHADPNDVDSPDSPVLSLVGLARYLGLPYTTLKASRSRCPDSLPPPFHTRPLRWRRQTVDRWLAARDLEEQQRIARSMQPVSRRAASGLV